MFSKFMKIENFYICGELLINEMTTIEQMSPEQKLREIESELVQIITSMGYLKGRSNKIAELAAYITIRKEITQRLIRELTGYSLGSVSSTLQSLENMGLVKKQKDPKSREYLYVYDQSYTEPQSRSLGNVFEYFDQLERFLAGIEERLNQPRFKEKKGYDSIESFVENMRAFFERVREALSAFVEKQKRGRK